MPTNTEIVKGCSDAFGRGDIPAILDACAENTEVIFPGDPSIIPYAGRWKGKAGVAEYFRAIGESVDVLKWNLQHNVSSGDRVASFGTMDLRVKATGKTITDTHWALDFTVRNAKLERLEGVYSNVEGVSCQAI